MRTIIAITLPLAAAAILVANSGAASAQSCGSSNHTVHDSGHSYQQPANYYNASYDNRPDHRAQRKARRVVRRILRRADYNRDGYLSRREARNIHRLRGRFHRIDRNRDGYLSRRELNRFVRRNQRASSARVVYR